MKDTDEDARPREPAEQAGVPSAEHPAVQPAVRVSTVRNADQLRMRVSVAVVVGLAFATAGFVDGVVTVAQRRVANCEDGHFFPEGTTNFDCYSHPHLGTGLGIAGFAVVLAILIGLTGAIAHWVLDARSATAGGRARRTA